MTDPPTITSAHNERLKQVRRLLRSRRERTATGRFVAEGEDLLDAAQECGWTALELFGADGSGRPGQPVAADALASVSTLGSGTRALAVYEQRWSEPLGPLCVALHGVADPGNVGTVLRAAHGFGASCVALGPSSADPYGPKAVRASMGAIFRVAVARYEHPAELPGTVIALDPRAGTSILDLPLTEPATLLVGAERGGLAPETLAAAGATVRIPCAAESLNAAMAATVALYELTRAHRITRS